jgi:heme exporter protein D
MENNDNFWSNLWEMGGYGGYVWSSFSVAAIIILLMFAASLRALKKSQKTLEKLKNEA